MQIRRPTEAQQFSGGIRTVLRLSDSEAHSLSTTLMEMASENRITITKGFFLLVQPHFRLRCGHVLAGKVEDGRKVKGRE